MEEKDLNSPEHNINDNLENKEEVAVSNEAPIEEKVEKAKDNSEYIPFEKREGDIYSSIEEKRTALLASYKKSKLVSRIFMIGVVALVIAAIVVVPMDGMVFKILGYSLAGVALLAMVVFYFKTRNTIPGQSKEYMRETTQLINNLVFTSDDFTDLEVNPTKKITRIELAVDRIYKEGIDTGSRNAVRGKYKGKDFEVTELILYYASENKKTTRSVGFLGKYLTLANNLSFAGRYIFNYKTAEADKVVDQPNDTEDLEKIYDEDNLEVYGASKKDMNELFGTDFIKKIREFTIGTPLMNLSFVVWGGHTAIYLSYNDSVTTLPFEHPFEKESQESYQRDLIRALDLFTKFQ